MKRYEFQIKVVEVLTIRADSQEEAYEQAEDYRPCANSIEIIDEQPLEPKEQQ